MTPSSSDDHVYVFRFNWHYNYENYYKYHTINKTSIFIGEFEYLIIQHILQTLIKHYIKHHIVQPKLPNLFRVFVHKTYIDDTCL